MDRSAGGRIGALERALPSGRTRVVAQGVELNSGNNNNNHNRLGARFLRPVCLVDTSDARYGFRLSRLTWSRARLATAARQPSYLLCWWRLIPVSGAPLGTIFIAPLLSKQSRTVSVHEQIDF